MSGVVIEARKWIGTPYLHQASVPHVGCDCLGLIRGIWRSLHGSEPEAIPNYTPDWNEAQGVEALMAGAMRHLTPVEPRVVAGDVILFRMRSGAVAKHLGIVAQVTPTPTFIHAYSDHGVVESPLSGPWRRRIVGHFSFNKG